MKVVLYRLAALAVLLLAVGSVGWDVVWPEVAGSSEASRSGYQTGMIIGIVIRTAILLGIAGAFFEATLKDRTFEFGRILKERAADVPAEEPPGTAELAELSDSKLLERYDRIIRPNGMDAYRAVLWAMKTRLQTRENAVRSAGTAA